MRNSNPREASQNSLTPQSSKLKLRIFFLHHDVYVWQLQHLHWEFQCNYANFENILEIPLTLIKQTCSTQSIWRVQARIWCGLCLKLAAKQRNWNEKNYRQKYKKKEVKSDEND